VLDQRYELIEGDVIEQLRTRADRSVQCVVTSPPYWALRDYGTEGQIGRERTPAAYVATIVAVFREVWRVLKDDGVVWLNLGDTYSSRTKGSGAGNATNPESYQGRAQRFPEMDVDPGVADHNLVGIPWRVALALQADGWLLRSDVVWHKTNAMPESVRNRPTKAHEYVFLLAKQPGYYYNADAIREAPKSNAVGIKGTGRARYTGDSTGACPSGQLNTHPNGPNARTVWPIATGRFGGAHFATFPEELASRCIRAGSREDDVVLDPFNGAATTGVAALRLGRRYVGIEISPGYIELSRRRIEETFGTAAQDDDPVSLPQAA
jgi:DNA modification methylase